MIADLAEALGITEQQLFSAIRVAWGGRETQMSWGRDFYDLPNETAGIVESHPVAWDVVLIVGAHADATVAWDAAREALAASR